MAGLSGLTTVASGVWKVFQLGVLIYALCQLPAMREHWLDVLPDDDATVLTVQLEGFWGPVHALVPRDCEEFDKAKQALAKVQEADEDGEEPKQAPAKSDEQPKHAPAKPQEADTARELVDARRLSEDDVKYEDDNIIVKRCGKEIRFKQPTGGQRYWAMLWLSGSDSIDEMRTGRQMLLWLMMTNSVLEFVLNFGIWLAQNVPGNAVYDRYQKVEEENSKQPIPLKIFVALCGLVGDGFKMLATMQSQFAILSLFAIFLHNGCFITSFIPGKAYAILLAVYVIVLPMNLLLSLLMGKGSEGPSPAVGCAMCVVLMILLVAIVFVLFPLAYGYGIYNFNFLWNTGMADAVSEQSMGILKSDAADTLEGKDLLHREWAGDETEIAKQLAKWLFGSRACEAVTTFVISLVGAFLG